MIVANMNETTQSPNGAQPDPGGPNSASHLNVATTVKEQIIEKLPRKKRIGYILRRFPSLSETFILNEVLAMEGLGTKVEVYSILQPRDPKFHEGITRLQASIRYIPTLGDLKSLARYNRRAYRSFGWRYLRVLASCVATFKPMQVWRFFQAAYIAERARERKIEHFHAHFANRAANVARLAHEISGIPYSFTAHAVDIYKNTVRPKILKKRITKAEFVVTVSDENQRFLRELAPAAADKIHRIYNGIDFARFGKSARPLNASFTILCVGRMVEKKGLEYLIQACHELKKQNFRFRCNIIGKGNLRPKLNAMINELDLKNEIKLVGVVTQDKIGAWFTDADIFVLPCIIAQDGNREGLPVSIVEALASGLPVVTTAVAGISEAVKDGENGFLVPEHDAMALAEAVRKLLVDRDYRDKLSRNARRSVQPKFDQDITAQTLKRLLTRGEAPPPDKPKMFEIETRGELTKVSL